MDPILNTITQQGPYAALFIWLFFKTIKESKEREDRLMSHVERTTDTLQQIEQSVSGMQEEIKDIREQLEEK
ncbi:bacteriocin uviB [Priestia flexa]|uniref:BhlA/UviB family holin-like peptide n=1 Tax=Priestia flexa TaxID=86664 RepID=UPI001A903EEC|nr:BhlA/UviB family holin-like peptide [Priestia flexa]MBN8434733.1 bacteriocin uviB [Priestia flexa]MCA0967271.1 bacteriocin uviB [Priestia flexa]